MIFLIEKPLFLTTYLLILAFAHLLMLPVPFFKTLWDVIYRALGNVEVRGHHEDATWMDLSAHPDVTEQLLSNPKTLL